MTLGATVVDHFTAAAGGSLVVPGETKPFIPHITVAKTSRVMSRHRRGKGVASARGFFKCSVGLKL